MAVRLFDPAIGEWSLSTAAAVCSILPSGESAVPVMKNEFLFSSGCPHFKLNVRKNGRTLKKAKSKPDFLSGASELIQHCRRGDYEVAPLVSTLHITLTKFYCLESRREKLKIHTPPSFVLGKMRLAPIYQRQPVVFLFFGVCHMRHVLSNSGSRAAVVAGCTHRYVSQSPRPVRTQRACLDFKVMACEKAVH